MKIMIGRLINIDVIKILLFSTVFIIVGCTKDDASMSSDAYNTNIKIEIETEFKSIETDDDSQYLFEGEYRIRRVRIITFDGDVLDQNIYREIRNTDKKIIIPIDVRDIKGKFVYVIVNESESDKVTLDMLKSQYVLRNLKYSIASYFEDTGSAFSYDRYQNKDLGFETLPMSGYATIDPIEGKTYPITVHRTMARVDVWLRGADDQFQLLKETATKKGSFLEYNTCENGNLFDKEIVGTTYTAPILPKFNINTKGIDIDASDGSDEIGDAGEYQRIFTYYTPERISSDAASRLRFTITDILYKNLKMSASEFVLIDDDSGNSITEIKRNNVYSIYCTIMPTGDLNINYKVEAWDEVEIEIPPFE